MGRYTKQLATVPRSAELVTGAAALSEGVRRALEASLSENTRRSYLSQWELFESWCRLRGRRSLPAEPADVADYLVERATGHRMATLSAGRSAVSFVHRARGEADPCSSELVRSTLRGLARKIGVPRHQKGALTDQALEVLREKCQDVLTLAMVHVMGDAGLRRSEASALTWGDVEEAEDGSGLVTVKRSKTDQEGEGEVVAITPRSMALLRKLGRQDDGERVFPLSDGQIARRIKAAAREAGLGDDFSGHSPRIGMARRMAKKSAPDHAIMRQGRWKDPGMVSVYTRGERAAEALRYLQ